MNTFVESVRKLMGWCPICNNFEPKKDHDFIFENPAFTSSKPGFSGNFETSNVAYPANNALITLGFTLSFNLLLSLDYFEVLPRFLAWLALLHILGYITALKTFEAEVFADSRGIQLRAFRFRNLEIPYREIENFTESKLEKRSKRASKILICLGALFFAGFLAWTALESEWRPFGMGISILPFLLLLLEKQKNRYGDLDTRLYIKTRDKKWYEISPYYSVITDEDSAAQIKTAIEEHTGDM